MTEPVVVGVTSVVLVTVMYAAALSGFCNHRRWQHGRRTAPLDGIDLGAVTLVPVQPPRPWPKVEAVDDPAQAAAYASLADDRVIVLALFAELLVLVSGAATGVLVADLFPLRVTHTAPLSAVVLVGVLGAVLRLRAARVWEPVAARYRARYAALTAEPLPEPVRRTFLGRLLGRA